MPFKKLHSNIKEKLSDLEIVTPTPFQSKSIPVIKGGANVYCTASENSGKTTILILTTLHKLKCEVVGDSPRAIVLVENKEKVLALYDAFKKFIQFNTLRLYASYEQLDIEIQDISKEAAAGAAAEDASGQLINLVRPVAREELREKFPKIVSLAPITI